MTGTTESEIKKISFEDLISPKKYQSIEAKIMKCANGLLGSFHEEIKIKTPKKDGEKYILHVTPSQKYNGFTLLIGLLAPTEQPSNVVQLEYKKLLGILEDEKVDVTGNLASKLHDAFEVSGEQAKKQGTATAVATNIFSKREQEVLNLSCKGLPIKIIADQLCISDRTVEKHRAALMEKTGAKNIVEVIIYALKNDMVEL